MLKTKKSKIIVGIISLFFVIFVFGIVWFFTASEYARFKAVSEEALDIAGHIGTGDYYFTLDTKFSEVPFEEMSDFQYRLHLEDEEQAIKAIKYTNLKLGFNDSLYSRMLETTANMGEQYEENDKYIVSWSFAKDDGLEVKYKIKNILF